MFAYCNNSPGNGFDPNGEQEFNWDISYDGSGNIADNITSAYGFSTDCTVSGSCSIDLYSDVGTSSYSYTSPLSACYDSTSSVYSFDSFSYYSGYNECCNEAAFQSLQSCADAANTAVPGYGPVVGTFKHTAFAKNVTGLGNPSLLVEQSYSGGGLVSRGTKGSIRFDVLLVSGDGTPICAWDFKTGIARLTEARIRTMLEKSGLNIPIFEIR